MSLTEFVVDALTCLSKAHRDRLKWEHKQFKDFEGHHLSSPDYLPPEAVEARNFLLGNKYIKEDVEFYLPKYAGDEHPKHYVNTEEGNKRLMHIERLRPLFAPNSTPTDRYRLRHCVIN